jgi:hypothetical protein
MITDNDAERGDGEEEQETAIDQRTHIDKSSFV